MTSPATRAPALPPYVSYRPSWFSQAARVALVQWLLCAALIAAALVLVRDGYYLHALAPALALLPMAWLAWRSLRKIRGRQPVLRLSSVGVAGRSLREPLLPWSHVADIRVHRVRGQQVLDFHLALAPGQRLRRNWRLGLPRSVRRISLTSLRQYQQLEASQSALQAFQYWNRISSPLIQAPDGR